jgi:threonine dehydrogenase-like Zn-dependent dehydrogenase
LYGRQTPGADLPFDRLGDLDVTGGQGADVVIEEVGKPETIQSTLDLVAFGGRIVIIGHAKDPVPLPMHMVLRKEVDLLGSRNSCRAFPEVIDLVRRGSVDLTAVVSHRLPFRDAVEAFHLWHARTEPVTKIVLHLG